ncbi:MAG: heme exporter protein CcmB [Polyangia bacterium]
MGFARAVWLVLVKDLRVELRSREIVISTALFAVLVVVLAGFALGTAGQPKAEVAPGVLWLAVAFAGVLALSRTFLRERELGVWTALLLTPAPHAALFLGKALGVVVFLLVVEIVLVPVVDLMFHAPLLSNLHRLAPVLLLGTVGYSVTGTLFASMTVRTRLRDLLLGVILFPLVSPVLIAAVKASAAIVAGGGMESWADLLGLLAVFDILFVVLGLWLFGPLMED